MDLMDNGPLATSSYTSATVPAREKSHGSTGDAEGKERTDIHNESFAHDGGVVPSIGGAQSTRRRNLEMTETLQNETVSTETDEAENRFTSLEISESTEEDSVGYRHALTAPLDQMSNHAIRNSVQGIVPSVEENVTREDEGINRNGDNVNVYEFPEELRNTLSEDRLIALRGRRDAEATRQHARQVRRSRQSYVLPFRVLLLLTFSILLLLQLKESIDSFYVVFIPLWIINLDKILQAAINFHEGLLESRLENSRRDDLLLPAISSILIDVGSIATKVLMVSRLAGQIEWPYRTVFTPSWIAIGIATVLIGLTPERNESQLNTESPWARVCRRFITSGVWCSITVLMPLLIVNKVDRISNNSWSVVFMPIWFVLVTAGIAGAVVLPTYSLLILLNCFRQAGLHSRSDRRSIAKLIMAFSYGIVTTVTALSIFLNSLSRRLSDEWRYDPNLDSNHTDISGNSSFHHANHTQTIDMATGEIPSNREVSYESIMLPLIAGFANLFVFVVYVRFVMIMRRVRRREMARLRFEQEAFDPQGGSTGFWSASAEQTLFESIVEPVFLEADEDNLLFEIAESNDLPVEPVEDVETRSKARHGLTKVSPEAPNADGTEIDDNSNIKDGTRNEEVVATADEAGGEEKIVESNSEDDSTNFFSTKSGHMCFICADQPPNAALLPCGHGGLCYRCGGVLARQEPKRLCPICRGKFTQVVKICRREVRHGKVVYVAETGMKLKNSEKTKQQGLENDPPASTSSPSAGVNRDENLHIDDPRPAVGSSGAQAASELDSPSDSQIQTFAVASFTTQLEAQANSF